MDDEHKVEELSSHDEESGHPYADGWLVCVCVACLELRIKALAHAYNSTTNPNS